MDAKPIDADNHYYETLDAFTRHLEKKYRDRGVKPVLKASGTSCSWVGR